MKSKNLLFIINPKSGNTNKSQLEKVIDSRCKSNNREYTLFYTTATNDLQKIREKQQEVQADILVACGGDGTVNLVAEVALELSLTMGIIPLGSANGLAYELNIEEDVEEALDVLLEGNTLAMDVVKINQELISLHLGDLGFNAKMIKEFEESGERGMLAYARAFFRSLIDKETTDFRLEFNGSIKEIKAEMIVIANASSYGTGAVINPGSKLNDGSFELVIFKPIPIRDLLSLTLDSFLGNINESPYVEIYKVEKAKIICQQPELLQIDGELKGKHSEVEAEILKACLHVIC